MTCGPDNERVERSLLTQSADCDGEVMSASEYALTAEDNAVHVGMVMGWKKQGTVKEMGVAAEKSLKVPTS